MMVESLSTVCQCFGYIDNKKTPLRQRKLPRKLQLSKIKMSNDNYDDETQQIELNDENQESLIGRYKKHSWVSDKESSIIIIGAGEAGIHMASILKNKGFNNVKIMEIKDRKGNDDDEVIEVRGYGKSQSIFDKEYEVIHELGTAYIHRYYDAFFELIGLYDDSNNELIPIDDCKCNIQIDGSCINQYTNFTANAWINNDKTEIFSAARKYIKLHKKIFSDYEDMSGINITTQFPPKPINDLKLKAINMSFLKFINKYKLNALIPYLVYNQSLIEGFGNLDEIPAFYGLLWNNVRSINNFIDDKLQKRENLWCLKKGFSHLFSSIVEAERINIEYSLEITSINRYLNDEKHKICVMYNDKKQQKEKLIECDVLFCSSNIKNILPLISDITNEEQNVFKLMSSHTMCITLFESNITYKQKQNIENKQEYKQQENEQNNFITFYPNNLLKKNGHVFKIRNSSKIINGINKHYKIIKEKGLKTERFVSYQMINKDKNDLFDVSFEEILLNDLKNNNKHLFKNIKIIKQNIFSYCPQWNRKDINSGIPWFVKDELQGKYKNMYYIGSSVCFQSIESILQYNVQLQHKLHL